jgi:hypothetical protein
MNGREIATNKLWKKLIKRFDSCLNNKLYYFL